jgi:hypothetical protein
MAVPYTFGSATAAIPLSNLDSNFATTITLGNTAIQLGNTVTTLNNMTLANVTVSSGNVTFTNVSATTANVTTGNVATLVTTSITNSVLTSGRVVYSTTGGLETDSANLTFNGTILTAAGFAGPLNGTVGATTPSTGSFTSVDYSTTLTGGTGIVNLGSGQFYKDTSGNLGIGVTPSAWFAFKAIQIGAASFSNYDTNTDTRLSTNYYESSGGARYIKTNFATIYQQTNGKHVWFYAPSGTAGALITLTQAMTLDASGNLGIGTTSPSASAILDAQSTTKGVRMPNMTTTQKNAISSPATGLMVFDTTLAKLCVYSGSAWQTITSV